MNLPPLPGSSPRHIFFALPFLALVSTSPGLAGGNPVDGAAMPEQRQLMVIHGANHTDDSGDFVSSATGLDTYYSFGLEVPIGTQRLQVEVFDPDVAAGPGATEEDFLNGTADSIAHYLLLDPSGQRVPVRFGLGDGTGPADDAWALLYDSDTAAVTGDATFADRFDSQSYGNSDGTDLWGDIWEEVFELGLAGPGGGQIEIVSGHLRVNNEGNLAPSELYPRIQRAVDLSGQPYGTLSFDWSVEGDLEDDDAFVVEASPDNGATWLGLGLFSGLASGTSSGHAVFDLSAVAGEDTVVRFRVLDQFLEVGEAFLIDNVEIRATATSPTAPPSGHWKLIVDMSSVVNSQPDQQDDRNAFAIRAHDGDPGAGGTEIDVYSETYLPIGVNRGATIRTYQAHPYITRGCTTRVNDYDFDKTGPTSHGFWAMQSRLGIPLGSSQGDSSASNHWLSTVLPAGESGVGTLAASIQDWNERGNVATLYLGNFESADPNANGDGSPGPTASPELGALRIYLPTDSGEAPGKSFLVQPPIHVSGPLQPVPGMTTRFGINVRLGNPSNAEGPLTFDAGQAVRVSVPGEEADADVCFGGIFPGSPTRGTLESAPSGCAGTLVWNPGPIDPGTSTDLIYFVDVTPKESTWAAKLSGDAGTPLGTHATLQDTTGTELRLGDLCPFALGHDTVSLIGTTSLEVTRTPDATTLAEGDTLPLQIDIVYSPGSGQTFLLDTLEDQIAGNLDGLGDCVLPQFLNATNTTYSCTYPVVARDDAESVVTSVLTAGGKNAGPIAQSTHTYTILDAPPVFDLALTADPNPITSGGSVTFTLEVTNTSFSDPLEMIELSDSLGGDFSSCQLSGSVLPGETWQCLFDRTIMGPNGDFSVTVDLAATDDEETSSMGQAMTTVTIVDLESPTVSFGDPPVDSLWLLSPPAGHADGPRTQTVTLEITDNDPICQIELRLLTDEGATPDEPWVDPTAESVEIIETSDPCDGAGLAVGGTWATLVEVPRIHPSGHPDARYVLEAKVTDATGRSTSVRTDAFEIDQRSKNAVKTLLLTHRGRLPGTPEALDDLEIALWDFANHSKVEGVLVDLGVAPGLLELYTIWDTEASNNPLASYDQANALLLGPGGIRDLVLELRERYQNLLFLQIVGDDRVVPFARLTNQAVSYRETNYVDPFQGDLRGPDSTVGHALGADKFLSDDPLATLATTPTEDVPFTCEVSWDPPDFGIGRLVETPEEIQVAIQGFLDREGLLDLEAAPEKVIQIAGYDFLREAANDARKIWSDALDLPPFYNDLSPLDKMLIFPGNWGLDTIEERSEALLTHLTGNGGDSYGIVQLYGHATHFQEGVPAEFPTSIEGLDAACLYDPSNTDCLFAPRPPLDLEGSFVYSTGCHSGLTVPGSTPFDLDNSLDLAQSYLARGALGYLASTGYSFGVTPGIGLIERFGLHLNDRLTKIPENSLRDLVMGTKRAYYGEDHCFNPYDLKTAQQLVLYGFPMAVIRTGLGGTEGLDSRPFGFEPEGGGPPHLQFGTTIENFSLADYVKFDAHGLEHPEAGCEDPDGCYYTFAGRRSSEVSDLPIQPYFAFVTARPGFEFRGILWKGGTYVEEPGWRAARTLFSTNNPSDPGRLEGAPRHVLLGPVGRSLELAPGNQAEGLFAEEEVTLLLTLGESIRNFDDDPNAILYNRQRLYQQVVVETFWYNSQTGPLLDDEEGPEFLSVPGNRYHSWDTNNPGTLNFEVPVQDPDNSDADSEPQDVWRVVVVYNDGSLEGDSGLEGSWQSLELEPKGGSNGRLFVGDLTFDGGKQLTYVIQAIDFQGNISWLRWTTTSIPIPDSGLVPEIPLPVDIDPELHIEVAASPDQLEEPGGSTTISVTIQNIGGAEVVLDELSSTLRGQTPEENDLVEVCGLPQTLSIGGEPFVCNYQLTLTSEPGTITETVRARGTASDDRPVPDASELEGSVEIDIPDALPTFQLSLTQDSPGLDEPGGPVAFTLEATNLGNEGLTMTRLVDDDAESLLGDCPLTIAPGASDSCSIVLEVSGNAFETVTRTLSAGLSDNEGNEIVLPVSNDVLIDDALPSIVLALATQDGTPNGDGIEIDESSGMVTLELDLTNASVEEILDIAFTDDPDGATVALSDCDQASLPVDGTFPCSFDRDLVGQADLGDQMTITVEATARDDEGNTASDQQSLTLQLVGVDWGDAPAGYEVVEDEAHHTIRPGFYLGSGVDSEAASQPTPLADGDDASDGSLRDDEDGVTFPPFVAGGTADIEIDVALGSQDEAHLEAWFDWNEDGLWDDSPTSNERFTLVDPIDGLNLLTVTVPATATPEAEIFARFRLSTTGPVGPSGDGGAGEVEDHVVTLERPELQATFVVDPTRVPEPMGTVTFTLTLTNPGTVDILIEDLVGLSEICLDTFVLAVGETFVCSSDVMLEEDVLEVVTLMPTFVATAEGVPLVVLPLTATATLNNVLPQLDAIVIDPAEVDELDELVTMTLLVTNTAGPEALLDLQLTHDDGSGDIALDCDPPTEGGNWQVLCTFDQPVSGQADQGTVLALEATASATDDENSPRATAPVDHTILVTGIDRGDAPDSYEIPGDEARHTILAGFFLGSGVDSEAASQPTPLADGDDLDGRDDEDGVTFPPFVAGGTADIEIDVALGSQGEAHLEAWFDWNEDGLWDDSPTSNERFTLADPSDGLNVLTVTPPAAPEAEAEAEIFARFRLSTTGPVGPGGDGGAGEVEDHVVTLERPELQATFVVDPTRVPEPMGTVTFTLTLVNTGTVAIDIDNLSGLPAVCPTHFVVATGETSVCSFDETLEEGIAEVVTYSPTFDATALGVPLPVPPLMATATLNNVLPLLDATVAGPDEVDEVDESVTWTLTATNANGPEALVDLTLTHDDGSGDFVLDCAPPVEGENWQVECTFEQPVSGQADQGAMLTLAATASATDDENSPATTVPVSGSVPIVGVDWGDAPASYETSGDEAQHRIASGFYLGAGVDSDLGSQASDNADGDDFDGRDDDDGVTFPGALIPGEDAMVEIVTSLGGQPSAMLDAWIDWNEDGDWDDPDERVFTGEPLTEGLQTLTVAVPADAPQGMETLARFRLSSSGVGGPGGLAAEGEVEDHTVGILDIVPPQITELTLEPGGPLVDCLGTGASPIVLDVVFSEPMADPAGDDGPNDVTNPANYRLLAAGPDRELQTPDCGPIQGDDQVLPSSPVVYDLATATATLQLAGGQALGSDLYRFVACDALTDPTGNLLDGDGDSAPGGVLARTFRVDAFNLFSNGHLDCDLGVWDGMPPGEIVHSTDDHQDSGDSGSARVDNQATTTQGFSLGQCLELPGDEQLVLRSRIRVETTSTDDLELAHVCDLYGDPLCDVTSALGSQSQTFDVGDSGGSWVERNFVVSGLTGASSAWCAFDLLAPLDQDFSANLDALFLGPVEPVVFIDGFESGDTSEWTTTMP